MHASQQEVDAEIGHQDGEESEDHEEMEDSRTSEKWQRLCMHGKAIDEQGNQGPDLLRIPSPVASPAHIGPDGTDEDAGCHAEEGGV